MLILLLGYISILFHVYSFLLRDRKKVLIYGSIALVFYIIHILLSGSSIGTVIIASLGLVVSLLGFLNEKKRKLIIKITPVLALTVFIISGMDMMSFFAALGTFFSSSAKLVSKTINMKYLYLGSATSWLITGILLGTVPAILYDILGLSALFYSIYDLKKEENILKNQAIC